jgi:hypothetical protein
MQYLSNHGFQQIYVTVILNKPVVTFQELININIKNYNFFQLPTKQKVYLAPFFASVCIWDFDQLNMISQNWI